jgi:glycosyltransferase involved in cell wall biosynthesis
VYESGSNPESGYTIALPLVRELYRVCDILFIPSHREGFGMPILEAGLIGMPVFSSEIPAAEEIRQRCVVFHDHTEVAKLVSIGCRPAPPCISITCPKTHLEEFSNRISFPIAGGNAD